MIDVNELRKGVTFVLDGTLYKVLDYHHQKPGRGSEKFLIPERFGKMPVPSHTKREPCDHPRDRDLVGDQPGLKIGQGGHNDHRKKDRARRKFGRQTVPLPQKPRD